MPVKPGSRLNSQVCETEILVIRVPIDDSELECGGLPMVEKGTVAERKQPVVGFDTGTTIGKRYVADDEGKGLEVLATKGGAGALSLGGTLLLPKESKPLPSSD